MQLSVFVVTSRLLLFLGGEGVNLVCGFTDSSLFRLELPSVNPDSPRVKLNGKAKVSHSFQVFFVSTSKSQQREEILDKHDG